MNVDTESDSESSESNEMQMLVRPYEGEVIENDIEVEREEIPLPADSTFDLTLPASHSYLGQNLQELRGRTVLDDEIYINLPLLGRLSLVLFPGQRLPLIVFNMQIINMLQDCVGNDRTFGVVCWGYDGMGSIGTTAEIYEYRFMNTVPEVRLKAEGRQRFKILRLITQDHYKIYANVKVLPEITLDPPFLDERLASLDHLRVQATNDEELKKQERIENLDATITPWPAWVYRQYDPLRLSRKIRHHLQFIEKRGGNIPEDPTDLSFWVAQNLLVDNNEKILLLNYDCAISRLQREVKYLIEDKVFICGLCSSFIAKQSDLFPMSKEGTLNAFCNPAGVIHETVTLYHAQGLVLNHESTSTVYSWFPGYAWTIATCKQCHSYMGWQFTAVEENLIPKAFWGLTRKSLKNRYK